MRWPLITFFSVFETSMRNKCGKPSFARVCVSFCTSNTIHDSNYKESVKRYCHLGHDADAGKAVWHASTSCLVH